MKKLMLLLVVPLVNLNVGHSTNVSGEIYSDITWTMANSPYIVTDTIVVFPGVTLTIQPGVVVKFAHGMYIELNQSTLIANGTKTDSITFTSNDASPTQGSWNYIYFYDNLPSQFNYCTFLYATDGIKDYASNSAISIKNSIFEYNTYGIYDDVYLGQLSIDSSDFMHNLYAFYTPNQGGIQISNSNIINNNFGIFLYNNSTFKKCNISNNMNYGLSIYDGDTVMNCSITNNGTGLICGSGSPVSLVEGNVIEDNSTGIEINWDEVIISCNKICNNTPYNLVGPQHPFSGSVINNYWCSTDSAIIKRTIYDGYDNINYSIVPFMPIDTGITQCDITAGINNLALPASNSILVYPNPSNGVFTLRAKNQELKAKSTVEVYNVLGEKIYSQLTIDNSQLTINPGNQPNGVYLYRVIANSGELAGEGKLVIQK